MKALIPAAGRGTRLMPQTSTKPKPLVHIAGKPIIGHILDNLDSTQITEVIVIVGYMRDKLEKYLKSQYSKRFRFIFVEQDPRMGLGHAVFTAKEFLGDEPVFIALGDMLFLQEFNDILKGFDNLGIDGLIAVKEVDAPERYGIVVNGKNGLIKELIEKPNNPPSNLAITGIYVIRDTLGLKAGLEWLMRDGGKPGKGGEYQLTDALQYMIRKGASFRSIPVGDWYDCGRKDTLLKANKILLKSKKILHSKPINSVIIPPVVIAKKCKIKDSLIGPNVSVSEGSSITSSIITDSIIGNNSSIQNINLCNTLIGDGVRIQGNLYELNVGDGSTLGMK